VPKLTFPKPHKHTEVRSREHLTPSEVEKLRKAARSIGRHGERNDTMVLLAYRHGLRVSELITLRWGISSILTRDSFTSGASNMGS
jgi:type 1 fimbriae regulatory protein FimB/type 1 fimbriae regulatory protein FimE